MWGGNSTLDKPTQTTSKKENPTTLESVNQAPIATFDKFTINRNTTYDGQLTATDADGDTLKYIIVTQPSHGSVVIDDNGCFTYTPEAGYQGSDTFSYKASDDISSCAVKTVTIDVCEPKVAKPAAPTNLTVKALTATTLELYWEDNSDNEDGFVIYRDGKLICNIHPNQTHELITYDLKPGVTYTFEVKARNAAGVSSPATVQGSTKDVTSPPNAPTELKATAIEETCLRLTWKDNSDNESTYEIYQDGVKVKTVSAGCHCAVVGGLEKCTDYAFTVKAVNKIGFSDVSNEASVKTDGCVVVENRVPTAKPQSVTLDEDTSITITLAGTDPDGDALTYTVATLPSHGTFDGTTYTPYTNYHGSDSFSFTANDGSLTSAPATVTITVTSNDTPSGSNTINGSSVPAMAGATIELYDAQNRLLLKKSNAIDSSGAYSVSFDADDDAKLSDFFVLKAKKGDKEIDSVIIGYWGDDGFSGNASYISYDSTAAYLIALYTGDTAFENIKKFLLAYKNGAFDKTDIDSYKYPYRHIIEQVSTDVKNFIEGDGALNQQKSRF